MYNHSFIFATSVIHCESESVLGWCLVRWWWYSLMWLMLDRHRAWILESLVPWRLAAYFESLVVDIVICIWVSQDVSASLVDVVGGRWCIGLSDILVHQCVLQQFVLSLHINLLLRVCQLIPSTCIGLRWALSLCFISFLLVSSLITDCCACGVQQRLGNAKIGEIRCLLKLQLHVIYGVEAFGVHHAHIVHSLRSHIALDVIQAAVHRLQSISDMLSLHSMTWLQVFGRLDTLSWIEILVLFPNIFFLWDYLAWFRQAAHASDILHGICSSQIHIWMIADKPLCVDVWKTLGVISCSSKVHVAFDLASWHASSIVLVQVNARIQLLGLLWRDCSLLWSAGWSTMCCGVNWFHSIALSWAFDSITWWNAWAHSLRWLSLSICVSCLRGAVATRRWRLIRLKSHLLLDVLMALLRNNFSPCLATRNSIGGSSTLTVLLLLLLINSLLLVLLCQSCDNRLLRAWLTSLIKRWLTWILLALRDLRHSLDLRL